MGLSLAVLPLLIFGPKAPKDRPDGPTVEDLKQEILAMRISDGLLRGSYHTTVGGAGTRFHEVLQALRPVAGEPRFRIGDALDAYIRNVDISTGLIQDFDDDEANVRRDSDSDDAYAASLLHAASDFARTAEGKAWWNRNRQSVETIVDKVILQNQVRQSNGGVLIRTFSAKRAQLKDGACRLTDCCEVYGSLSAALVILGETRDENERTYRKVRDDLAKGIGTLYSEDAAAFYVMDTDRDAKTPFGGQDPAPAYPYVTAQPFPELYRVPIGDGAKSQSSYDAAWAFLNSHAPAWPALTWPDASTGSFPWMLIGYVAARRGLQDLALRQTQSYAAQWSAPPANYNGKHIGEIGYRLRIAGILGS